MFMIRLVIDGYVICGTQAVCLYAVLDVVPAACSITRASHAVTLPCFAPLYLSIATQDFSSFLQENCASALVIRRAPGASDGLVESG